MLVCIETPEEDDQTEAELFKGVLEGAAYGAAPSFKRRQLPRLRDSGIVFAEDPNYGSGVERFHLPWEVYEKGEGDCNDVILYGMCELIAYDRARPVVRCTWLDGNFHVQLRRSKRGPPIDLSIYCGARVDWPRWLLQV